MANVITTDRKTMRAIDRHLEATTAQVEAEKERRAGRGPVSQKLAELREAGLRKMKQGDRERFLNGEPDAAKILKKMTGYQKISDYAGIVAKDLGGDVYQGITGLRGDRVKVTPSADGKAIATVEHHEPITRPVGLDILRKEGISGHDALSRR